MGGSKMLMECHGDGEDGCGRMKENSFVAWWQGIFQFFNGNVLVGHVKCECWSS